MLQCRAVALSCIVAIAMLAAGCASSAPRAPGPLRVVATTSILGEFAREVAGADAEVSTLIPPGADPHSFEAPTQAARALAAADVIVVNGYNLEGGLLDVVAANRRSDARVVVAAGDIAALTSAEVHADDAHAEPVSQGALPATATAEGDPHMWLDPELAAQYVEHIGLGLAQADPTHAESYRGRALALAARLRGLRAELVASMTPIPTERRRIVVFHDAFAYFARAFDFRLSAGVLPEDGGREPSARALADTVALVREQAVPAVFSEPQFPSTILDAVARETGARLLVLYSDAYGAGIESYEQMMRANARSLLDGLAPRNSQ